MTLRRLRVNGVEREVTAAPDTPLVYILRNDLGLKGTRFGCGEGQCGACTVILDGRAVPSCDLPLWSAEGHEITTVEGIGRGGTLHPVQQAFIDVQAAQCGYCCDGIVMAAVALLDRVPDPSDEAIVAALERHLCRCGAHARILRAIRVAAAAMAKSTAP
ncbi:MAG TPA: (2Fe-2S)-binding protein [Casimicrobiaceae bacterium]|nr:(2Fe-2S)-binding protein [Casimicrobiaceae bacterium]